jgi:lipoate-protein ligase B
MSTPTAAAPNASTSVHLVRYSRLPYREAWALQQRLVDDRIADRIPDTLLLLEHDPVYTLGRRTAAEHLGQGEAALRQDGSDVVAVERGGSITYHGPGQLVGYPILKLNRYCPGPKRYMTLLEEVIIRTLAQWGLEGKRLEKLTGVWVSQTPPQKIAAMGVYLRRGVTMHGFALNVCNDLKPFTRIVPCGLEGGVTTSMTEALGRSVSVEDVGERLGHIFATVFDVDVSPVQPWGPGLNVRDPGWPQNTQTLVHPGHDGGGSR